MSETLAAIRELESWLAALRRVAAPRAQSECARLTNALGETAAPAIPSGDVLKKLRTDLQLAIDNGGVAALPPKLLRSAPLVFWHGERPAISIDGLFSKFLDAAAQNGQPRPRLLRTLIEAWLHDFAPDLTEHAKAGRAISTLLARGSAHPTMVQWRRADERYAMFDAVKGPERVASALLRGPHPTADLLRETGMNDPLRAQGGFFRHSVGQLLKSLPVALQTQVAPVAWVRAAEILEVRYTKPGGHGGGVEKSVLRFSDMSGEVARASLAPWLGGNSASAPRDAIKSFLLRVLGDPRVSPTTWAGAGEAAIGLMRSWLAKDSLEAFLSLISKTNDGDRWKSRQAFWRACMRKAPSPEVWIVLGPTLAERADLIRDLHGSFGRMSSAQNSARQAVLLIRLNNIVLSEWSDIGPIRAWPAGSKLCPALYQPSYGSGSLTKPCMNFEGSQPGALLTGKGLYHNGSSSYLWQDRAAAFLREHTGIDLRQADYTFE